LRLMNRSDHWQNLAWLGRVLLLLYSVLTLGLVYHRCQKSKKDFIAPRLKVFSGKGLDGLRASALKLVAGMALSPSRSEVFAYGNRALPSLSATLVRSDDPGCTSSG
jgi:hypothetical protein